MFYVKNANYMHYMLSYFVKDTNYMQNYKQNIDQSYSDKRSFID